MPWVGSAANQRRPERSRELCAAVRPVYSAGPSGRVLLEALIALYVESPEAKRPDDRSLAGWIIQPVRLRSSGSPGFEPGRMRGRDHEGSSRWKRRDGSVRASLRYFTSSRTALTVSCSWRAPGKASTLPLLPMNALRLEDGLYLYGKLLYILDSSLAEIQRGKILHRNHRRVIADSLSDKSIPDFEKNPFRFTAPAEASGNLPSKPREPKLCPRFLESAIEILIYRKHVQGLVVLPIFRQITRQVVAVAEVMSRLLVAAELLERRHRGFNGGSGIPSEEAQGSEFDQHPGRCYPVSADPAEHRRSD